MSKKVETEPTAPTVLELLQSINDNLLKLNETFDRVYGPAKQGFYVEILQVGTKSNVLYTQEKLVRAGFIMNLSATDVITITGAGYNIGVIQAITPGQGILLNPANVAGQGGGVWNFANIDLSTITAITNTNDTQSIAVVYYT